LFVAGSARSIFSTTPKWCAGTVQPRWPSMYLTKSPIFTDHIQFVYVHNSLKISVKQDAASFKPIVHGGDSDHNTHTVALINGIMPVTDVPDKRSDFQSSSPMM
jgi:hypothetical protein